MEQGGNVLLRHFDGHPNLFVYPFESQMGTSLSHNLLSSEVHFRYMWPEFLMGMTAEESYQSMYDEEMKTFLRTSMRSKFANCGIIMDEKERIRKFKERFNSPMFQGRENAIMSYFHSTFAAWRNLNKTGKETHYVGYSPQMIMDTDKVFKDFPDAHIVHIRRNPFSGYADTLKRPFPLSLEKYCSLWNICQLYASVYQSKYPNNFHIIQYEELVNEVSTEDSRSKEDVMKMLCEKIGIPYSENLLYPSFNSVKMDTIYPWGTIEKGNLLYNLMMAKTLTAIQRDKISVECSTMLNHYSCQSQEDFIAKLY